MTQSGPLTLYCAAVSYKPSPPSRFTFCDNIFGVELSGRSAAMASGKKLIVLSDGTGNAASSIWRTNVWRVFDSLDLNCADQKAKYDDGVGSSSFKLFALFAGAFGFGLKRNVIDLYKFLCRNYEPGSRIYAFGFSRGAYTVRILLSFVLHQGLVPYYSESDLHTRARDAYRAFRAAKFHTILRVETPFRKIRDWFFGAITGLKGGSPYYRSENTVVDNIEFIGVWDTVAAYGLPVEEMTRGISNWIFPLGLPERTLDRRVKRACHALALDDERTTFHPILWTEEGESPAEPDTNGQCWLKDERISQVWFAGVHANIGGGYPDDHLAHLPLHWIMGEAQGRGLIFKRPPQAEPDAFLTILSASNKDGRQYDSRSGWKSYYRYGPRNVTELCDSRFSRKEGDSVHIRLPKIHESALARLRSDCNPYAPIGIPVNYAVATSDGRIVTNVNDDRTTFDRATFEKSVFETLAESKARYREQEKIWNLVWLRRVTYFLSLGATLYLVFFRFFYAVVPDEELSPYLSPITQFVRLVQSFLLPDIFRIIWTDLYATNPAEFLCTVLVLVVFLWLGSKIRGQIIDAMRIVWKSRSQKSAIKNSAFHKAVYAIRTNWIYRAIFRFFKYELLPAFGVISVLFFVWLVLTPLTHLATNLVDSTGVFCQGTEESKLKPLAVHEESAPINFDTSNVCAATGVRVEKGHSYIVRIKTEMPWKDGRIATDPTGFSTKSVPLLFERWLLHAGAPLRRDYARPWFSLVARVGAFGSDEMFVDPEQSGGNVFTGITGRARRSGELFLYVNEALVPFPVISSIFYWNNEGTAEIVIERQD